MASASRTLLFGDDRIASATAGRSQYGHTFGGPHDRRGALREDCNGLLIHLLHRLDLSDPAIPVAIPGIRWLPLYYCFDFRTSELGYRLMSDDSMETFFPDDDANVSEQESWPDEAFPAEFPPATIKVERQPYDPTRLADAERWAGVFGIGRLSDGDQTVVRTRVAAFMKEWGYEVPKTNSELDSALSSPFAQARPVTPCLNPKCSNHKQTGKLVPIALLPAEPVEGVHIFGEFGGGVQLIFMKCPKCHTIRVSNQSG